MLKPWSLWLGNWHSICKANEGSCEANGGHWPVKPNISKRDSGAEWRLVIYPTKICRSHSPFCGRSEDKQANKRHGAGNGQNEICNSVETLARHASFCLGKREGAMCTLLLLTSSFRSRLFIIFLHVPSWLVIIEFRLSNFPSLVSLPTSRMVTHWVRCVRHVGPGSGGTNWQSVSDLKSTAVCCHRSNSKPNPTVS